MFCFVLFCSVYFVLRADVYSIGWVFEVVKILSNLIQQFGGKKQSYTVLKLVISIRNDFSNILGNQLTSNKPPAV